MIMVCTLISNGLERGGRGYTLLPTSYIEREELLP